MNDEEALLTRAAAGEEAAFRLVYERHRADVARIVHRMLLGRGDLEDIIQEVFVQVFRSLKDFRGQSKFSTWLHRVTVNVVLMNRRAGRSRPVYVDNDAVVEAHPDTGSLPPDADAERKARVRAFGRLLDRLSEKKRTVFILHELEGMSPQEIAGVVGVPVLTVRTRLFYARREIEELLKAEPTLSNLGLAAERPGREP